MKRASVLNKVDADSGLMVEDLIIDFCKTPRTRREITELLNKSWKSRSSTRKNFLEPLINKGTLKMTLPAFPASTKQRYVSGEFVTMSEEEILEFCTEPKSRAELIERFELAPWYYQAMIYPLINSGKLHPTMPNCGAAFRKQKYSTTKADVPILTEEALTEFCAEPKSRIEISEYFVMHREFARRYIAEAVKKGILKMTINDRAAAMGQKYVAVRHDRNQ